MIDASREALVYALRTLRRRIYIRELHSLGVAGGVARRLIGVQPITFHRDARSMGLKFPYDTTGLVAKRRRADVPSILRLRAAGQTYEQIATGLGVSRQRVHQIVSKHTPPSTAQPASAAA